MGTLRFPEKVKLIVAMLSNDTALFCKAQSDLEKILRNSVDYESNVIDFTYTEYYNPEMGCNLKRKFLSFEKLTPLENTEKIKLLTNKLEKKYSSGGKRRINIDPGYLDLSKVVLFSTKDYTHRIYVGHGIFAEVTLHYKNKRYDSWPWTYPDYKSEEYAPVFAAIREIYKKGRT